VHLVFKQPKLHLYELEIPAFNYSFIYCSRTVSDYQVVFLDISAIRPVGLPGGIWSGAGYIPNYQVLFSY